MENITFYSDWDLEQNKAIVTIAAPWPLEITIDEEVTMTCLQATRKREGRVRLDVANGWAEYQLKEVSATGRLIGYYRLVGSAYEPKTKAA